MNNRFWTTSEVRYLKRFAKIKTANIIGEAINRTGLSVRTKAARLGISMMKEGEHNNLSTISNMQVEMIRTLDDAGFRLVDIHHSCFKHISYCHMERIKRMESRVNVSEYL